MAVARLHNVSALDSSFLRDSQSQASRQRADEGTPSTRAFSILQMWRELEDEHVVSRAEGRLREGLQQQRSEGSNANSFGTNLSESQGREHRSSSEVALESDNECETCSESQMGSQIEIEDLSNSSCEQSPGFGEVERERVRQIFRGWMNCGGKGHTSNVSQTNSTRRAQWLGENECERVRIIRGWVQMNSQQRGSYGGSTEEQTSEIGAQIERVRDGLVVNHYEGRTDHSQRGIRRLCGRQALLDMLVKAERERQRELQCLLEHRAVSQFAHRNRIQSLLRGRFLRNESLIENDRHRPNSTAASELGFLRQRNTVTGLREGFLSRLDNFDRGNNSDTLPNSDINAFRNEETQVNSLQEVPDEIFEQSEPSIEGSDIHALSDHLDDLEGSPVEDRNGQQSTAHVEDWNERVVEIADRNQQQIAIVEFTDRRDSTGENVDGYWQECTANEWSQETLGNERLEQSHLQEAHEILHERSEDEPSREEIDFRGLSDRTDDLEGNTVDDINWQQSTAQVEDWHEQVTDNDEGDWQQLASVEFHDWRDVIGEEMDGNWQETAVNDWSQEMSENEGAEPTVHMPETHEVWHEDSSQEAVEEWLDEPSEREAVPVARVDTFYPSDDDNVYSRELRELHNRRRVSNLLRSGFRESLDQLIQSYVERQDLASIGWELHETSPSPASTEHDQEQQSGDQNEGHVDTIESSTLVLPSPPVPQPFWDQGLHQDNWVQHTMHQRMGIEWEIINDLRIDLTRLQQRMNNMQRMLEACMDMQLELQRSIRQEVSSALNRSAGSPEVCDGLPKDGSKWDHVRKGICCMCCDSNIDSLLYRCGHMCTCSKCANILVQGRGKCPMCQAPVVEVIRAYSIL